MDFSMDSESSSGGVGLSSEFNEKFRNFTKMVQEKFPSIEIDDIPGLNVNVDGLPTTGANFLLFMLSLVFAMFWIAYITFFNSRIVGRIVTRIANRFVTGGYVRIGSLSWAVLPGKVMFRDVCYVTTDHTVRVQDGYVVFRWWRRYVPKDVTEDHSHSDTRVSLQLNGLELHTYNRTAVYRDLEKKFGYESSHFDGGFGRNRASGRGAAAARKATSTRRSAAAGNEESEPLEESADEDESSSSSSSSSYILGKNWRDLIPVIKIDMSSAKLVFGNRLLPTSIVISAEEAHCTYSTKPAGCSLDHFMHFIKLRAENFKVLLAPSPKYTGLRDEAPRFMGEGFVCVSSNEVNLYYYMDEAGTVPLEHGDSAVAARDYPLPEWGIDIKCGKGTDFSYGPWADRQRELIFKFFSPPDYQPMKVTPEPQPGEKRRSKYFVLRLSTEEKSSMDLLFSKQKETSAVHVNLGQGTNFELRLPWFVEDESGYTSTITGTLMLAAATTSLPYRELLQAETLEFRVAMHYPMYWNDHQEWLFSFVGTKVSLSFIFAVKWFFQDLIDDWSGKSPPDLLYFVPYVWKFKFQFKKFELLTTTNEFNWIDTSSTNQENSYMALCGEVLNINFDLPFTEFLPNAVPFNFDIMLENIDVCLFLPETNTSHDILFSLDRNAKIATPEGKWKWKRDGNEDKWRHMCKYEEGWIDCIQVPSVILQIEFIFHPMPMTGPPPQADVPTAEKEMLLLTPLRAPTKKSAKDLNSTKQSSNLKLAQMPANFAPDILEADKCSVKLYVGKCTAFLYGTLIRSFLHLKENITGEDQHFTAMDSEYGDNMAKTDVAGATGTSETGAAWDPRPYRPIEVILDLSVNNLQAHLIKNCSVDDLTCPFFVVEQIGFEMDKKYRETKLQLVLSPVLIRSGSLSTKTEGDGPLSQGHLLLTGLQFRGHAMFSELDRPLGSDSLEYAWLIEIQCGSLIGKIMPAQLYNIIVWLETFIFLTVDKENVLKHPRPFKICQHNVSQKECSYSGVEKPCNTVDDLKYRLVRFLVDSVDVQIVEKVSTLRLQSGPLRLATCNLHGLQTKQGVTALVKQVQLKQYIGSNFPLSRSDTDVHRHHQDVWIESGSICFGPVFIEGAMSGGHSNAGHRDAHKEQNDFLQRHDKTRKLWFLWPQALTKIPQDRVGKCGCVGGCNFFGQNSNGVKFFEPEKTDVAERKNVALPCLRQRVDDPGYGESILTENQLVVHGYTAFGVGLDLVLPEGWPHSCREPKKLPFCPDYRTHKSSSSHNSSDTPKHPKYHRSFSGKHGTPQSNASARKRSTSSAFDGLKQPRTATATAGSYSRLSSDAVTPTRDEDRNGLGKLVKSSSLVEVQVEEDVVVSNRDPITRTESLVSDVLSFYSMDGDDRSSKVSFGLSSPKSFRSSGLGSPTSAQYETASSSGEVRASSPLSSSSKYMSAASNGAVSPISSASRYASAASSHPTSSFQVSSPGTSQYETASQGSRTYSSMSFDSHTLQPDSPANLDALLEEDRTTISDHRRASSGSFISAVSEHDDVEGFIDDEDIGLVNLHTAVNKPITDSPLLMSSYISHLTQLRCAHWNDPVAALQHEQQFNSGGGKILADFDMLEEGFSVIKMCDKKFGHGDDDDVEKEPLSEFDWDTQMELGASGGGERSEFVSSLSDGNTSKTTIIVNFKGSIDIICCPIMLESVERMFDSLVTTFQGLHPISVVNHLHAQSVDRVESRNTLKKEKSLDLQEKLVVEPAPKKGSKSKKDATLQPDMFRTFEKSISSYVQASLNLPKVNVMVLQASVVEEMCAFSALDHVKDITCVSLLSLGIKETRFQLCKTSQSKKTVQMYLQNQSHMSRKKKKSKYKMLPDLRQNEPFTFESSETQREEILMTGSMNKMHAQLRRLRNDSSILQDAAITAVPNHKSKVFFDYVNVPRLSNCHSGDRGTGGKDTTESTLGYNMCECGLEGISLKVAKRSCNQDSNTEVQKTPEPPTLGQDDTVSIHMENETPTRGAEAATKVDGEESLSQGEDGDNVSTAGSVPSAQGQDDKEKLNASSSANQGRRSTASGSAELKTTWFNFAAPPKTPISKKIDFTKLDWNLLSTASPSIDAWLGPIDRLQEAASKCLSQYHKRVGATMACLMAEALDVAAENFLKLTKYEKLTALSKTLRDDPSCQLCSILLKYMVRDQHLVDIETDLDLKGVPPLTTLRQGIVVLSRQWKNALYTPILIEYNLRCRSLKNIYGTQMNLEPVNEEPYDESEDEDDDFDDDDPQFGEEALLIKGNSNIPRFALKNGSVISDLSASIRAKLPGAFGPFSDELVLLGRGGGGGGPRTSVTSAESNDFLNSVASEALINSGDISPTGRDLHLLHQQQQYHQQDESLYDWMKRQQLAKQQKLAVDEEDNVTIKVKEKEIRAEEDVVMGDSEFPDVDKATGALPHATPHQAKSMHLLDAHIIFEPLLSSLGLMPQQIQNLSLKNLGSNVSILGSIHEFKVDIIESEFGKRIRSSVRSDNDRSPSFLCEKVNLQIDFKKVTDINLGDMGRQQKEKVVVPPLYMTRAQLKRHTRSLINFSIDVHFISQKVNMPLLRLVNQIVTMHQNVKEANEELKENKPSSSVLTAPAETASAASSSDHKDFLQGHKKNSSGSSTSSNLSAVQQMRAQNEQSFSSDGPSATAVTGNAPHRLSESSSRRGFQTPSPSMMIKSQIRNRPKSFAQKFRPNSRLAGMTGGVNPDSPVADQHDSFILTSAPLEMITEEQTMIRCWKTMYNLLELYSTMPITKTVQRQSLTPVSNVNIEAGIINRGQTKRATTPTARDNAGITKTPDLDAPLPKVNTPGEGPRRAIKEVSFAKADVVKHEHTPIIVFGIAKIRRTKLTAVISGLKLEGEIKELQTSMHYREKIRTPMKGVVEASVIGNMQETNLVLLEGRVPNQQTVVKMTVGKTHVIHTSHMWKTKDKNCGTLSVDLVQVEIPQHPVDLHSIVTRGTKELSSTLQEFRGARILQRGRTMAADEMDAIIPQQSPKVVKEEKNRAAGAEKSATGSPGVCSDEEEKSRLIKPFVMQFNINMHKLVMSAALLPSLKAEYSMENLTSKGMTGDKATFVIDLPKHTLSFNTKLQDLDTSEAHLPSEASIDLPKVQVSAEYIQDDGVSGANAKAGKSSSTTSPSDAEAAAAAAADGSILSQGSYLSAEAEIGELEHSLTTDLLNHLVFVQKVFMKEVNEVVQKMSGSDRPVPVWTEFGEMELQTADSNKRLLYSIIVRLKNITITATTPANSGVRFETGLSELHISNRVQNMQGSSKEKINRVFTKAMVNLKLSLGQLIRDPIYYEAEPQFQNHAYFKTTVHLRNAFQGENVPTTTGASETDLICITLNRPLVFVQPIAVDRAILFWLSYKNAWEYWTEQRLNLNKEVLWATEQVLEKVPIAQFTNQLSAQHVGTLFLQLNVQDIGLCIPLALDTVSTTKQGGLDCPQGAIVATVESSSISACSARSTVSKGKFKELCIRFTDDFNHFLDDWKPDKSPDANLMNLCLVSEGSYEICSQTEKAVKEENAKWLLNVKWQMTGVDVHVDTNIGKHLSALGHTLTTLTGEEEEDATTADGDSAASDDLDEFDLSSSDDMNMLKRQKTQQIDLDLPPFLFDPNLDKNVVAKYLEHEINEQAKTVEDLHKLGASEQTITAEMKKLNELQNIASKNFRQDLVERIRRQKSKASYFKEKFGLGSAAGPAASGSSSSSSHRLGAKSKSVCIPSPTMENPEFLNTDKKKKSTMANIKFPSLDEVEDIEEDDIVKDKSPSPQRAPPFTSQHSTIDEDEEGEATAEEEEKSENDKPATYEKDLHFPRDAKRINLSPIRFRDQTNVTAASNNTASAAATAAALKAAEPNVDFEFHVNILVNSGKCVLHTLREDEREKRRRRMKKDRSASGGQTFEEGSSSPSVSRKGRSGTNEFKSTNSSSRLRDMRLTPAASDITTFHIPGLDVRVQYMSKTDEVALAGSSPESTFQRDMLLPRKSSAKKAVVTTWMTLQSIPEETIITPAILVFLEQALEPIPTFNRGPGLGTGAEDDNSTDPTSTGGDSTSAGSQTGLAAPTYSSFPVDVIVYFHMQSSTFRFSCLPISRVECMLRLPSLDLVFSSKRADGEINEEFGDVSPNKNSSGGGGVGGSSFDAGSLGRQQARGPTTDFDNSVLGGMSITGCLNDFSLYVFHPYGGGRKMRPEEMNFSPLTSEERKDSLSVHVAFVKFHISRSRKLNFDKVNLESSQRFSARQSFSGFGGIDRKSMTCVRFSTVIDIGSASFKYDMRRLSEILAFPKAWYRRTLVRRLFLGEFKTTSFHTEAPAASAVGAPGVAVVGGGCGARKASLIPTARDKRLTSIAHPENAAQAKIWIGQTTAHSWETLVMTAINFKELKVHMNMGNVMGNVDWISKDFRSTARLSIASTGHKNMQISLGLNGSNFEAKAGIVGGSVNVGRIDTFCQLVEDKDVEPYHKLGLKLDAVEVRFDYMGTSVLMGRISNLNATINDDWHVTDLSHLRPAQIFVRGELFWDQFQLMISKSTTADLLKIANKLEEFFSQQFKDSKKLFSSLEPGPRAGRGGNRSKIHQHPREDPLKSISHHRHWQRAMRKISGIKIYTLPFKLGDMGSVLGGVLELRGNHISVACFHGINFKSKSWALFSLKDPSISFVSDAQEIYEDVPNSTSDDGEPEKVKKTNIIQTLSFFLGQSSQPTQRKDNTMATVKKISRSVNYLPPIKTLTEWFNYAFKSSELDEVHRFPSLSGSQPGERGVDRDSRAEQRTEDIFALPCLKMDLKTIHIQGDKLPTEEDPKPVVDCTFFTDFENHIYVTTDAEAFFFLHDIISSYVKEKERVLSIQQSSSDKAAAPASMSRDKSSLGKQPIDPLQNDWRQFECNQWHLEPTVRLISWAGSEIEPYGVDYILQRLGFAHARVTIPKWLQRGCMDPLDKICSLLVLRTVQLVQEEKNKAEDAAAEKEGKRARRQQ